LSAYLVAGGETIGLGFAAGGTVFGLNLDDYNLGFGVVGF
jgi:hypothetical protein